MKPNRTLLALVFSAALGLLAAPAHSAPISSIDSFDDFANSWNMVGSSSTDGIPLSGVVYWEVREFEGNDYFVFGIQNTATGDAAGSRIAGFAWDFPDGFDALGDDYTGSSLNWLFDFGDQNVTDGQSGFDACTYPRNNCQAIGNTGIEVGDGPNWFYVGLTGSTALTAESFNDVRACLRFGGFSDSGIACRDDSVPVPAPAAIALLGVGILGIALIRRRRHY